MKFSKKASLAGLTLAAIATAAWATVSFNTSTGTGFIGRGDVITYAGKSNLVLSPSVVYTDIVQYDYDCLATWDTETGGRNSKTIHHVVGPMSRSRTVINTATVDTTTRQASGNGNISGYLLNGFGVVTSGSFSEADALASCPQGDPAGSDNPPATTTWSVVPGSFTVTPLGGTLTFNGVTIPF